MVEGCKHQYVIRDAEVWYDRNIKSIFFEVYVCVKCKNIELVKNNVQKKKQD